MAVWKNAGSSCFLHVWIVFISLIIKGYKNEYAKHCKAEAISWPVSGMSLYACRRSASVIMFRCSGRATERADCQGSSLRSGDSLLSLRPSIFFLHSTKQRNHPALQHLSAILQQTPTTQSMGVSGICVASCYYASPHLFLSVLLPVNGCHLLRAQFLPRLDLPQQMNSPFACVAFSFGLTSGLYMVILHT